MNNNININYEYSKTESFTLKGERHWQSAKNSWTNFLGRQCIQINVQEKNYKKIENVKPEHYRFTYLVIAVAKVFLAGLIKIGGLFESKETKETAERVIKNENKLKNLVMKEHPNSSKLLQLLKELHADQVSLSENKLQGHGEDAEFIGCLIDCIGECCMASMDNQQNERYRNNYNHCHHHHCNQHCCH